MIMRILSVFTAMLVSAALFVPSVDASATPASSFTVLDNSDYVEGGVEGALYTSFVPNFECRPYYERDVLPSKAVWQGLVRKYSTRPGPLVLDCEGWFFNGTDAQANLGRLKTLQAWAREIEPTKIIGWYNLAAHTTPENRRYYHELIAADRRTALFPAAYTGSALVDWTPRLKTAWTTARGISTTLPIYVYLWPQYSKRTTAGTWLDFLPTTFWEAQLEMARGMGFDGAVMWGSVTCDTTCRKKAKPVIRSTKAFIDFLQSNPPRSAALGRPTTASQIHSANYPAKYATDGDPTTRWVSKASDPQWLKIDLGSRQKIHSASLLWGSSAKNYTVQVSDDATKWTTVYSTSTGNGGVDYLTGLSGTGRYVRVHGTQRASGNGYYTLFDVGIYATAV
ncbi:discoidin domain-containing protein [Demetria terragena]|uniref:discoidin domain-containing protein n=1 Tax=Demetria terragena TaxID=63959 RepID=UPI0003823C8B|nr:discoidin domain-containing protein [Demetria terragena]